jgi:HD-like signal output (HDOD) protein
VRRREETLVKDLFEALQKGYSLPSLSPVAMQIVEMASDERCSAESMAGLIENDPSLAVRLLRLANSAFFVTRYPVSTVKQAIVRLGVERLRIMALSLSLRDTFPMGRVGGIDYEAFWRCSLYRALLGKSLAQSSRTCNPEEAFFAGLTLEIGLLIFVDLFIKDKEEQAQFDQHDLESLLSWEREGYGTDHRTIGEVALRYWRFPDSIVACQQLLTNDPEDRGEASLRMVCETARTLSSLICEESVEMHPVFTGVEGLFGLSQEIIHEMLVTAFDQVEEIAESLQVEVDKERDVIGLLEKANRTLTRLLQGMSPSSESSSESSLPSFEMLRDKHPDRLVVTQTLEAVSHEIRNPLVAVGGLARRLSRTLEPSSAGAKYVQSILDEVARLEQAMTRMSRQTAGE